MVSPEVNPRVPPVAAVYKSKAPPVALFLCQPNTTPVAPLAAVNPSPFLKDPTVKPPSPVDSIPILPPVFARQWLGDVAPGLNPFG